MSAAEWISWATNLITVIIAILIGLVGLQKAFNRKALREEAARQEDAERRDRERELAESERRDRERKELLATAQTEAQRTALASMHESNELLREECADCRTRLTRTEMQVRDLQRALRKAVRALDSQNPEDKAAAIEAAKDMC